MEISYSKILVPYDHSPSAQAALSSAVTAARAFSAHLDICYVVPDSRHNKSEMISQVIDDLRVKNPDVPINFMVRDGKIYKEVNKLEKELGINLIIMGTHGTKGFQSLLMGSNAFKVVSSSSCPVVTMQENATKDTVGRILLPLDDSDETRQKVAFIVHLSKGFGAEVVISSVSASNSDETKRRLGIYTSQTVDYLNKNGIPNVVGENMFGGNVADNCITLAESQNADLIVMMTETESSSIFMGTYAQQLINKSPIPVMAIHSRSLRGLGSAGY
jgi:nucleotide-binding universal stress UspA family protein